MPNFPGIPDWMAQAARDVATYEEMIRPLHHAPAIQGVLGAESVFDRARQLDEVIGGASRSTDSLLTPIYEQLEKEKRHFDELTRIVAGKQGLLETHTSSWRDVLSAMNPDLTGIAFALHGAGLSGSADWLRDRLYETAGRLDEEHPEEQHEEEVVPTETDVEPSLILSASRELILATTEINETMLRDLRRDPSLFAKISPRKFEELIAELFRGFGYEVELTAQSRDGGVDVIAVRHGEISTRNLIECKRYTTNNVGVAVVQRLHGVVDAQRANKGIVATTAYFSRDAKRFMEQHKWLLEGRDLDGVLRWIDQYLRARS